MESNKERTAERMPTREEVKLYWYRKTVAERFAALAELNRRDFLEHGIDSTQRKADWTVTRIPRQAPMKADPVADREIIERLAHKHHAAAAELMLDWEAQRWSPTVL